MASLVIIVPIAFIAYVAPGLTNGRKGILVDEFIYTKHHFHQRMQLLLQKHRKAYCCLVWRNKRKAIKMYASGQALVNNKWTAPVKVAEWNYQ